MTKVITVHGFNVQDGGAKTVGKLVSPLVQEGCVVTQVQYKWDWPSVRLFNKSRAKRVHTEVESNGIEVGIGHSNGCAILLEACRQGAGLKRLIFIRPALDHTPELPLQVEQVDVLYSPFDIPTRIGQLFLWHPWGDMGAKGYKGADPRWRSWNVLRGVGRGFTADGISWGHHIEGWTKQDASKGHNEEFSHPFWIRFIIGKVLNWE